MIKLKHPKKNPNISPESLVELRHATLIASADSSTRLEALNYEIHLENEFRAAQKGEPRNVAGSFSQIQPSGCPVGQGAINVICLCATRRQV